MAVWLEVWFGLIIKFFFFEKKEKNAGCKNVQVHYEYIQNKQSKKRLTTLLLSILDQVKHIQLPRWRLVSVKTSGRKTILWLMVKTEPIRLRWIRRVVPVKVRILNNQNF